MPPSRRGSGPTPGVLRPETAKVLLAKHQAG
jgi:hypothetical protein